MQSSKTLAPNKTVRYSKHCAYASSSILKSFGITLLAALTFTSCENRQKSNANRNTLTREHSSEPKDSSNLIKIRFTYGSEKEKWIEEVTKAFNAQKNKSSKGRTIFISHEAMDSRTCISEILEKNAQTHIISPDSAAFINIGNAKSNKKNNQNIVAETKKLCLSPVVIAMWKPMAEALGHGTKPIGWKEIIDISNNPKGWAAYGMPQWGKFRLGHTHPKFSNSGLISIIAETYAAADKQNGLSNEDVNKPETGQYLEKIEQSIVHYGKSTRFLSHKMFTNGPSYLSASILYENMVIESYEKDLAIPIVAIYPKEGTLYSDHPIGIVNRDWVTPEHQEASQAYINFLLEKTQQERAMHFGFRPIDIEIPLSDKFTRTYGVDSKQPQTLLELPSVPTINNIHKLWFAKKKKSHIVLAIDTSNSMREYGKMKAAKNGALQMLEQLGDEDTLSIMEFNSFPHWIIKNSQVGKNKEQLKRSLNRLVPNGKTALYDAIYQSFSFLQKSSDKEKKITAVVILSDGANTTGGLTSSKALLNQIGTNSEDKGTHIFTIAYGSDSTPKELTLISESAKGKNYNGNTANIKKIFQEIATFF